MSTTRLVQADQGAYLLFLTVFQDEEDRLLYDDANGMQYGSFGDQHMSGENDTLEVQRESEALQRVVAKTSKYQDRLKYLHNS